MDNINLDNLSVSELLGLFVRILQVLKERKVVRSTNNPVADYAEYLAIEALGLKPAPKSTKGFDATDSNGVKYEVKGRRPTQANKSRMLSAIRDCDAGHFNFLVGVLFNEDFSFDRACVVPFNVVQTTARYRKHVNAHILELKDALWQVEGVRDISAEVRGVIARDQGVKNAR